MSEKTVVAKSTERCTPDTKHTCVGMKFVLDNQGERQLGIHAGLSMDLLTGVTEPVFAYRTSKGGKLLTLNYCPWCGEKLNRAAAAPVFDKRAADTLAREVQKLIDRGILDARSPAADALLDYADPGPNESVPGKLGVPSVSSPDPAPYDFRPLHEVSSPDPATGAGHTVCSACGGDGGALCHAASIPEERTVLPQDGGLPVAAPHSWRAQAFAAIRALSALTGINDLNEVSRRLRRGDDAALFPAGICLALTNEEGDRMAALAHAQPRPMALSAWILRAVRVAAGLPPDRAAPSPPEARSMEHNHEGSEEP